jgi:phosphohistidine swiveling domain-containing protein
MAGLVTEVGGLMTQSAVVAREYSITTLIGVKVPPEKSQKSQMNNEDMS